MSKRPIQKKKWTVSSARQNLPALLAAAVHEPQAIYKRTRLVATVVEPAAAARLTGIRVDATTNSIGAAFSRLREICAEERYELPTVQRRDRRNAFIGRLR
jgi:hypothetical protein